MRIRSKNTYQHNSFFQFLEWAKNARINKKTITRTIKDCTGDIINY
jgi:hypothetical protein